MISKKILAITLLTVVLSMGLVVSAYAETQAEFCDRKTNNSKWEGADIACNLLIVVEGLQTQILALNTMYLTLETEYLTLDTELQHFEKIALENGKNTQTNSNSITTLQDTPKPRIIMENMSFTASVKNGVLSYDPKIPVKPVFFEIKCNEGSLLLHGDLIYGNALDSYTAAPIILDSKDGFKMTVDAFSVNATATYYWSCFGIE